jgi:tellurite resistance protein
MAASPTLLLLAIGALFPLLIAAWILVERRARRRVILLMVDVDSAARSARLHADEARAKVSAPARSVADATALEASTVAMHTAAHADLARAQRAATAVRHAAAGHRSRGMRRLLGRADDAVREALRAVEEAKAAVQTSRAALARAEKVDAGERQKLQREDKAAARAARAAAARTAWAEQIERFRKHKDASAAGPQQVFGALRSTLDGATRRDAVLSDAAMAACALVAAADGSISEEERERVAALIETNGVLSLLDSHRLARSFARFCTEITVSPTGAQRARDAITAARGIESAAATLLDLAQIVSRAEGVTLSERRVLEEIRAMTAGPSKA